VVVVVPADYPSLESKPFSLCLDYQHESHLKCGDLCVIAVTVEVRIS
jgi:hypothetical protein